MAVRYFVIANPPASPSVPGCLLTAQVSFNAKGKRTALAIRMAEWLDEPAEGSLSRVGAALQWASRDAGEEPAWGVKGDDDRPPGTAVDLIVVNNNWPRAWDRLLALGFNVADLIKLVPGDADPDWVTGAVGQTVGRMYLIDLIRENLPRTDLQLPAKQVNDAAIVTQTDIARALQEAQKKPPHEDIESGAVSLGDRFDNLIAALGALYLVVPPAEQWGDEFDYSELARTII